MNRIQLANRLAAALMIFALGACGGRSKDDLPEDITAQSPMITDAKLIARGEYLAKAGD